MKFLAGVTWVGWGGWVVQCGHLFGLRFGEESPPSLLRGRGEADQSVGEMVLPYPSPTGKKSGL